MNKMVERNCPTCHQKIEVKTGLHNTKNLFQWPSLQDWITLAILFLVLILAYSYTVETQACRDMLKGTTPITTTTGFPQLDLSQDYDIKIPQEEEMQG